jgi:hypothetical protein
LLVASLSLPKPGEVLCEDDDGWGNYELRPLAYIIGSTVKVPATRREPPSESPAWDVEWDVDTEALSEDDALQFEIDWENGVHDVVALWGLGG